MSLAGDHFRKEIEAIKWLKQEIEGIDYEAVDSIAEIKEKTEWGADSDHVHFLEDRLRKMLNLAFLYSELKKRLESTMEESQ